MLLIKTIKVLYKDKLSFWLLNVSLLLIISQCFLFIFKKVVKSEIAVLHYNIYSGFDVLASSNWIYIIPSIVLVLSILNFFLTTYFWKRQRIFSYLLLTTILLLNTMVFIYLYNIINYNI